MDLRKRVQPRPGLHVAEATASGNLSSDESSSDVFLNNREWNKLKKHLQETEQPDQGLKPEDWNFLRILLTQVNAFTEEKDLTKRKCLTVFLQERISAINAGKLGLRKEKLVFVQTQISRITFQETELQKESRNWISESDKAPRFSVGNICWKVVPLLLLFAAIIFYFLWGSSAKLHSITNEELVKQFKNEMKVIIDELDKENSNMKFVNKSLFHFIREPEHAKPGIILLLGANQSSCSLCHLVWHFVKALNNFYNKSSQIQDTGYMHADAVSTNNENEAKRYIEEQVEGAMKIGNHWVIMEDINKFPLQSLTKVQAYLDHENPPHKNVVYFVTAIVSIDKPSVPVHEYKELSQMAQDYFDDQWIEYEEEHRRALMGRMTSVIGWINEFHFRAGKSSTKQDDVISNKCQYKCR